MTEPVIIRLLNGRLCQVVLDQTVDLVDLIEYERKKLAKSYFTGLVISAILKEWAQGKNND